jgi:hypothetical protein
MTEDELLAFLDWMDGRGIAVTEDEAYLRLEIAEYLETHPTAPVTADEAWDRPLP